MTLSEWTILYFGGLVVAILGVVSGREGVFIKGRSSSVANVAYVG